MWLWVWICYGMVEGACGMVDEGYGMVMVFFFSFFNSK